MPRRYATDADLVGSPPGTRGSVAPELATVHVDDRVFWLTETQGMLSLDVWGNRSSTGHALLAAHFVSVATETGEGADPGPVQSMGVGPASVTYAKTAAEGSASDEALRATKYGRMYLAIRRRVRAGLGVRMIQ